MKSTDCEWFAFIPVRSGSKGLPSKNIRSLAGEPLYVHTVKSALMAKAKKVIISTDIEEILSADHGDDVCILRRPSELCGDAVAMQSVIHHGLKELGVTGTVCLLQATSPLRNSSDIYKALTLFKTGEFDLVMSVTEADPTVQKWGRIDTNGRYIPLCEAELCFSNRQSLPPVYKPNGAIYVMDAQWFIENNGFVTNKIGTITMPRERSADIDSLSDFEACEKLFIEQK